MIYSNIKAICKERGISVSSLEKQAGLGNGAITKWDEASPTIDKLKPVAELLEMTIDALISEKAEEKEVG